MEVGYLKYQCHIIYENGDEFFGRCDQYGQRQEEGTYVTVKNTHMKSIYFDDQVVQLIEVIYDCGDYLKFTEKVSNSLYRGFKQYENGDRYVGSFDS